MRTREGTVKFLHKYKWSIFFCQDIKTGIVQYFNKKKRHNMDKAESLTYQSYNPTNRRTNDLQEQIYWDRLIQHPRKSGTAAFSQIVKVQNTNFRSDKHIYLLNK